MNVPLHSPDGEAGGGTRYLRALREHWPLIALTVVVAVLAALAYASLAEKRYQASADLLVSPVSNDDPAFTGLPVLRESVESRSVVTVARLLRSPQVADDVMRRLGLDMERSELLERLEVRPQEQSNIVTALAEGKTPAEARRLANGFAETLLARRDAQFNRAVGDVLGRLQGAPGQAGAARSERIATLRGLAGGGDPTVQIASRAVSPSEPSWPRPALSLAVALLAGVLIGMGMAVGLEIVNPLVLKEEQLRPFGAAILGRVPRASDAQLRNLRSEGRLPRELVDGYRLLCAQLERAHGGFPRSVLVTSASSAPDRAAVSLLLGTLSGRQTSFIDAHLDRGTLRSYLDETASGGRAGNGSVRGRAARRLRDPEIAEFGSSGADIEALSSGSELIVIDAPSPSKSAEAFRFATQAERVLVVVRLGRTRQEALEELMGTLSNAGIATSLIVVGRKLAHGHSELVAESARAVLLTPS